MFCPICHAPNPDSAAICQVCSAPLKPTTSPSTNSYFQTLQPGTPLQQGKFSIDRLLGQGGFGITYLGQDTYLQRPVAIKELFLDGCIRLHRTVQPSGSITPKNYQDTKRRFLEEARALSQFQHPGIVHVYGCFEENNTSYIVMEFLHGQTLLQRIEQQGKLSEAEALRYIRQIGEALSLVHQANLLHRDIKPENILITTSDRAVLIDFGTARTFLVLTFFVF